MSSDVSCVKKWNCIGHTSNVSVHNYNYKIVPDGGRGQKWNCLFVLSVVDVDVRNSMGALEAGRIDDRNSIDTLDGMGGQNRN